MFKCKICGRTYTDLSGMHSHIEKKHMELVPKNMTVPQYYYFMKTGKTNGNCVMCKQPTSWNKNTNKYNRFCTNPECKEKYVAEFRKRMISKYGKVHLLNDPTKQREMLANRKISGKYRWSDGTESVYTGSYELDFVKLLDLFMEWDPVDISMPSPHTYTYVYEGEERYYIPDVFIHSLDLEIEVKDGGDNPNMHHKIRDVDKVKEKLKDEVLMSQKAFHYIKITNKNYTNFFNFLKKAKEGFAKYEDEKKIPRIFLIEDIKTKSSNVKTLYESTEIEVNTNVEEIMDDCNIETNKEDYQLIEEFAKEIGVDILITESVVDNLSKTVKDLSKLTVFDLEELIMFNYNAKKNDPEEIKKYIKKLIKTCKTRKDMMVVRNLMKMYVTHTEKLSKNDPTKKALENEYKTWVVGEYQKEFDKKMKKVKESFDYIEFERDKYLEENNSGKINISDDNSGYKDVINYGVKHDIMQLKEGAISFSKLNNLLSDKDHERLAKYMDDYESFYRDKLKEDPTKSKNINTEVSKARKYIEDLGRTGKVNNDLVKYAVDRIDHSGLCIRPRMESAGNIASLSVVVGADTKRSSFGLTDFDTKIFINDNYSIKRPNDINSMNCILSQDNLEDSKEGRRVFKYEVKINNNEIDLDSIIDKYGSDTISIPQMFKLNEATDCKFIKNVCSQLGFGNCEIKLVEDVIY